jgi:tetratricopeptide (TPR) repeat protein
MEAQTQSTDVYLKTVQWVHDRRKPLLIGGVLVAVLGLALAFWAWTKATHESDANAQFFAAPIESTMRPMSVSAKPLLDVASAYPGTAAGEHAQALAAEELFLQGKYPEAYQQFSQFIDNYPDSALLPQAKVGAAACLEAQGKTTDAITKYHEIILTYPTEVDIVSPAKLTLARLYEESNQLQQAMNYYVELARVLSQNPNDPWAAEARERAELLASKHPELMKAFSNAAPSNPQSGFTLPDATKAAGGKPGTAPAAKPAPKTAPPGSSSGNEAPNLLSIPVVISNSTGKP